MRRCRGWAGLSTLLCGMTMFGCGSQSGTVLIRGTVTDSGQPLEVQGRDVGIGWVEVLFYRMEEDGSQSTEPESTLVAEDGTFDVPGPDGHGLPPGKYRICIRQWDPYPEMDRLEGRFDEQNSPIFREIKSGQRLEIDISRPDAEGN